MAGLASAIVASWILAELLVWAMTPDAADSSIIRVTTAAKESIRLEPDVEHTVFGVSRHNLLGTAVARATKLLADLVTAQSTRIEDQLPVGFSSPSGGNMTFARTVARFTGNTGYQLLESK